MNSKQRTTLVIGLVVIVVTGLFPPYTETTGGRGGYRFLFQEWLEDKKESPGPPLSAAFEGDWAERERTIRQWAQDQKRIGRQLDGVMLFVEWVIVAAATGVFFLAFGGPFRADLASRPSGRTESATEHTEDDVPCSGVFCYHCGKPIEEGQSPCPACGKEVDWSKE